MILDCPDCRHRLRAIALRRAFSCPGCPADDRHAEWYPAAAVEDYFCRHHVIWLLSHRDSLSLRWPPQQSGYVPQPGYSAHSGARSPHERCGQVSALLRLKLEATNGDGETLCDEVDAGHRWPVTRAAQKAQNYMAGSRLRRETYANFKSRKHENTCFQTNT